MAMHPASTLPLALAIVVGLFALASASATIPRFFDPCHEWGTGLGESNGTARVALDDECSSRSGSSQTRGEAALNLVAIQGVLLLAAAAIVRGTLVSDRTWTGVGATLIAAMVPPFGLGVFWIPTLLIAVLVLVAAARLPVVPRQGRSRERVTAYTVGAFGVGLVVAFLAVVADARLALLVAVIGAVGLVVTALIARVTPRE